MSFVNSGVWSVVLVMIGSASGSLSLYYNTQCVASDGGFRLPEGAFSFPDSVTLEARSSASGFVMATRAPAPPYTAELRADTCDGGAGVLPFLTFGSSADRMSTQLVLGCLRPRTCTPILNGFSLRTGLRFIDAAAWFPDSSAADDNSTALIRLPPVRPATID